MSAAVSGTEWCLDGWSEFWPAAVRLDRSGPAADPLDRSGPAAGPLDRSGPAADPLDRLGPAADPLERSGPAADPLDRSDPAAEPWPSASRYKKRRPCKLGGVGRILRIIRKKGFFLGLFFNACTTVHVFWWFQNLLLPHCWKKFIRKSMLERGLCHVHTFWPVFPASNEEKMTSERGRSYKKGNFNGGILESNFTSLFWNIVFIMLTSISTITERTEQIFLTSKSIHLVKFSL